MKKYIYILASIWAFAACTTEEILQPGDTRNDSEVNISFTVDIPSTIETRSTSVPERETVVENLALITFDATGDLLDKKLATYKSDQTYTATISNKAKTIQFISNYEEWMNISAISDLTTLSTNEYVFSAQQSFDAASTSTLSVSLLRNWAKIQMLLPDEFLQEVNLTAISFCVYNEATNATLAPVSGNSVNLPSSITIKRPVENDAIFKEMGEPYYLFENNNNQKEKPTFVILRGIFGSETTYSYYKIDLSATNKTTSESYVYDVIRNYQYNIKLKKISRSGVSWDEVTDPNKLPDYNIITSIELIKYPSITFGDESLEVSKTTYIFTNPNGSELEMTASYKKNGEEDNKKLQVLYSREAVQKVVKGDIKLNDGVITATIQEANNLTTPIETSFYVKGGDMLQRKVTLILRNPYEFENVGFTPSEVAALPDQETTLNFTIPSDVDESVFPLECKIYTKKLYAVQEGVRIETTGSGEYYYVYKALKAGKHSVVFKTNSSSSEGELVKLSADLFADASAGYTTNITVITIKGVIYYKYYWGPIPIQNQKQVTYRLENDTTGTIVVGNQGSYSLELPSNVTGKIVFTYYDSRGGLYYTLETTIDTLLKNSDIILLH